MTCTLLLKEPCKLTHFKLLEQLLSQLSGLSEVTHIAN